MVFLFPFLFDLFFGLWLQEEARKALESALGGKKDEFEKWNQEIKKREEVGGGGEAGGGGWFGWGGRFGWSNGDHFWQEAQQACLAILGIIIMVSISYFPFLSLFVDYRWMIIFSILLLSNSIS